MSLRQIAKELGISHTLLSLWLHGKRTLAPQLAAKYNQLVTSGYTSGYKRGQPPGDKRDGRSAIRLSFGLDMAGARGSRTHSSTRGRRGNGFEVRESHRAPSAPVTVRRKRAPAPASLVRVSV